jgi:hypothetical protein
VSHLPTQLVVLAGLVWNPPGSCAWAARVYVSNADAQRHGVKARESATAAQFASHLH